MHCSDKAWFHTPFTQVGLAPEGCSSYTFPQMMGPILANDVSFTTCELLSKSS